MSQASSQRDQYFPGPKAMIQCIRVHALWGRSWIYHLNHSSAPRARCLGKTLKGRVADCTKGREDLGLILPKGKSPGSVCREKRRWWTPVPLYTEYPGVTASALSLWLLPMYSFSSGSSGQLNLTCQAFTSTRHCSRCFRDTWLRKLSLRENACFSREYRHTAGNM